MTYIKAVLGMVAAAIQDFRERELQPEGSDGSKQLPPIRFEGDPTEVYLA